MLSIATSALETAAPAESGVAHGGARISQASAGSLTAVAMSGGVDSSTVAAILCERGDAVVGLTMQLWNQRRLPELRAPAAAHSAGHPDSASPASAHAAGGHRCCSLDDVYDARRVAQHLGFPYYVVNYEREFEDAVIRPFVSEYLRGRTPIPCTLCNNHLKFDRLVSTAREIGASRVATGHYARIGFNSDSGRYELLRSVDSAKDQTYFLFGLTQEQLACSEFPLGAMNKEQVRVIARLSGLPVAEKPESQEICFVANGDYVRFIQAYVAEQGTPASGAPPESRSSAGEIVNASGEVLGRHNGLENFTVGQRKGLGLAVGRPLYVLEIDPAANRVIVGDGSELASDECIVAGVNWVSIAEPEGAIQARVQIRHRHPAAAAEVRALPGGRARVRFLAPQRAITPGQAAVFYGPDVTNAAEAADGAGGADGADGNHPCVLGGGWIEQQSAR